MRIFFRILVLAMSLHSGAHASLGEKATDNGLSSHQIQKSTASSYRVQMTHFNGREIREYIDQNNVVFAVSWKGRSHPDLSRLLGAHFSEYQNEVTRAQKSQGRFPKMFKTSHLQVHFFGHMRSVEGYAFEERLLPADFTMEALK